VGDTTVLRGHFSGKITRQPAAPLKPLSGPVGLAGYRVRKQARVGGLINEYRLVV
jgi:hypothetical protein